jgi:ketosteroid isomerase-like protein
MGHDHEAILAANEAFYRAFRDGDRDAMDAVWARHAEVACIHPGAAPLSGREDVIDSWNDILGGPPPIQCVRPQAYQLGDTAFVICGERVPGGVLVATNTFVREDGAWRMVHHHAGIGVPPQEAALN